MANPTQVCANESSPQTFRNFNELNLRSILYYQHDLCIIDKQLRDLEDKLAILWHLTPKEIAMQNRNTAPESIAWTQAILRSQEFEAVDIETTIARESTMEGVQDALGYKRRLHDEEEHYKAHRELVERCRQTMNEYCKPTMSISPSSVRYALRAHAYSNAVQTPRSNGRFVWIKLGPVQMTGGLPG